ncbi:MAG: asparagine--tRNA ligase, partial [Planctomycetes bacterium]|nr:asparagine--tRNA ligase [Planctomycetota bacterium]
MIGKRDKISEVLASEKTGHTVQVKGWIRTKRDAKGFSFLELNDGSCMANIQAIADENLPNYDEILKLGTGCSIGVTGELVASPGKGQNVEIRIQTFKVYGWAEGEAYPLQKKRHSFEFLRTIAHLRPRTNTFGAVFRVRNALSYAIHKFFQERGFIYVHTPIISTSDCEGAGEMFRVTTLDMDHPPQTETKVIDFTRDFFGAPAGLTVSGQLEAETMATALCDVYTFGPTFRADNSNTSRHLAEFWMVEPEMAFYDLDDDMDLAEEFLKYLFRFVMERCPDDMAFFNQWIDKGILDRLEAIVNADFERITYTEAIRLLEKSGRKFEFPVHWGIDMQSEHERHLTEEVFKKPAIVSNYPEKIKPFYMRVDEVTDPERATVAAMDVLVPKVGEIIGGSQREERADVLLKRIQSLGLPEKNYWWYTDLRRFGTVPHAGFGLGFERAVMYVT